MSRAFSWVMLLSIARLIKDWTPATKNSSMHIVIYAILNWLQLYLLVESKAKQNMFSEKESLMTKTGEAETDLQRKLCSLMCLFKICLNTIFIVICLVYTIMYTDSKCFTYTKEPHFITRLAEFHKRPKMSRGFSAALKK
ncbi:hypothetical protein BY458DRAFT_490525 [Sporodiniella umbellata]|nr:hypothetical protein BY458DRAFT_490525 [Sporodiniella umbellata]